MTDLKMPNKVIYVEAEARRYALTSDILRRFPRAVVIDCERYGEVFNRRAQNFRLQKQQPALILAVKHDRFVLPAPDQYEIGGGPNFYFSHMLNCLYDCRYCFLQGMYQSANQVLFVNHEDLMQALQRHIESLPSGNGKFSGVYFSGYDCDSLAFEPVSRFAQSFLPFFRSQPRALFELRTKSTQVRSLLKCETMANCVVAFSFTPAATAERWENAVPSMEKRLAAMVALQQAGWPLGLRFDPLIYHRDYRLHYSALFETIFTQVEPRRLHSITLGLMRLPRSFFKKTVALYPHEALWVGMQNRDKQLVSYREDLEQDMITFCRQQLLRFVPENILFVYA